MKSPKFLLNLAILSLSALLSACGSSSTATTAGTGNNGGGGGGGTVSTYPVAVDSYEGSSGDNTIFTASTITVGQSQNRTLWPEGDSDYVQVALTAGTPYEFSADHLCATCDTTMALYATDGTTQLASNDNYIGMDSRIAYTPPVTGTYYLKVAAYNTVYGVAAYTLNVHPYVDSDGDGVSSYYDCDDGNASIYPNATEIPGDGISQNCSGSDELASTTPDPFEPDNSAATAQPLYMTDMDPWEIQHQQAGWSQNRRTLHAAGEKDFFSFTLAPYEAAYLDLYNSPPISLLATLYDSDGTTPLGTFTIAPTSYPTVWVPNATSANKTFYVSYEAADGVSTTWYVPALYSAGVDYDGDGYYTRDWDSLRDCNDVNAYINPAAPETPNDGVDSNCNGYDNM